MERAFHPTCSACGGGLLALSRCASCGVAARVKGYVVQTILAQHPHARVYAGRSSDGARVAIKELLFALVPSVGQVDAFTREAAFLQGLTHRHTPRFIEAFSVGEGVETRLYLVQEFIEGESLQARLQREPLSGAAFDDVATQVLETLVGLHQRKPPIVHRDIKPANLLFREDGELVLVDFGSARHLERGATFGSTLVGTLGYMPPEQLGGTVDESSDLYALGASLLHAATGQPPAAFLADGMDLELPRVPSLSPKQNAFLARLTASRRSARFSTAAEALHWLRSPYRSGRRRGALVAAGLVGLVALVAFAASRGPLGRGGTVAGLGVVHGSGGSSLEPPDPGNLQNEARAGTRALWTSEASYFAERDRYTEDLAAAGFAPDVWCPDGARLHHTERPLPGEAVGCHFLYGVLIDGTVPQQRIAVYARGAVAPVQGKAWVTSFQGPRAGIPEEWTNEKLLSVLSSRPRLPAASE